MNTHNYIVVLVRTYMGTRELVYMRYHTTKLGL